MEKIKHNDKTFYLNKNNSRMLHGEFHISTVIIECFFMPIHCTEMSSGALCGVALVC